MHVVFLVEERSAEEALEILVPRILPDATFETHPHEGKLDLLGKLEGRLRGYAAWIPEDFRIVVLIDEDRQPCTDLKSRLEDIAKRAGLRTKSANGGRGHFHVLSRLAIEELEAWFLGDVAVLVAAYPGVPTTLDRKEPYRDCDAIRGGTAEALGRVLQKAGYHLGGLQKIRAAREIAPKMDPDRNRSRSFAVFVNGLRGLAST